MNKTGILLASLFFALPFLSHAQPTVTVSGNGSPMASFAIARINESLAQKRFKILSISNGVVSRGIINIFLTTVNDTDRLKLLQDSVRSRLDALKPEGFTIHRVDNNLLVIGKDDAGAMYGGLELAERIKTGDFNAITEVTQNPYMMRRGIKMNIPLDARTPSYTDASDAGQQNIPEMWSMEFWKEHIDSLASYRYNFISLWSLHPFPSLVKVPEYPDVALNDVHRSTIKWNEYYSTRGTGLDGPDVVDHYEVVKKMSIDDKIKFWQEVMRYGKNRNIDFYIVTWNTFTNSTRGKYGITDDLANPVTKDYFRKSVKQLFITYPDLVGIGLTTGENMPGADFEAKENWSFETYGQGVLDVVREQPDRKITFIHRQHETGALDIVRKFAPLVDHRNINFIFSFKYAQAHVYSSTTQIYHPGFVKEIQSEGNLKTLWTLRNDDVYYFRWGAPDFVREFIKNIPLEVSEGYYFGSDQHIWGREFMDRYPGEKRAIELAKHWYHWMLWGRLGYDPTLKNDRFIDLLKVHFPETNSQNLFQAWQSASMIYPLTTGFHWGALDFQWYIEGSKSRPEPAQTSSGFHDINRFITLPPHKGTDFISIPDYVKTAGSGAAIKGTTPPELAALINQKADLALGLIKDLKPENNELYKTIADIRAMAYLGKYYAHKISAAANLALFRNTSKKAYHTSAIKELNTSAFYWRYYASMALAQYKNPLWTNRVGYVDWRDLYNYALKDITDNGGKITLPDMRPSLSGTVLEAEKVKFSMVKPASEIKGYTGSGYITMTPPQTAPEFVFQSSAPGSYRIEFRYIYKSNTTEANITVNNVPSGKIIFWPGGSAENWVLDNTRIFLGEGEQRITTKLPDNLILDHINITGPLPER